MSGYKKSGIVRSDCVALIDLIGIKEVSVENVNEYRDRMLKFQKALAGHENKLDSLGNGIRQIYVVSDGAVIASNNPSDLILFLAMVRKELLLNTTGSIFLKAAVRKGSIDAEELAEAENCPKMAGFRFGTSAVKAFVEQDQLKGIGISIQSEIFGEVSVERRAMLFDNIHFSQPKSNQCVVFKDVKLTEEEINFDPLKNILRSFYKARTKSPKFERFYTSLLCNWVFSVNWSLDEFEEIEKAESKSETLLDIQTKNKNTTNTKKDDKPVGLSYEEKSRRFSKNWQIFKLMVDGYFEKTFPGANSVSFLYFATLKKIYNTFDKDKLRKHDIELPARISKLESNILGLRRLQKLLPQIPDQFFSKEEKDIYVNRLVG